MVWIPVGSRPKWKRKMILGKKACTRKVTTGRKNNTHACREDLTTLGVRVLVMYCNG
jgi:hypothetical protein